MFHISLKNTSGWVSACNEATLKKIFSGSKPSSKSTLKTKWYHSCSCSDDSQVVNNWRSVLLINILKKSQTLNSNQLPLQEMYVTITILEWVVSSRHICFTEIVEEKQLKLSEYLNQIWGPLATLSVPHCFGFFWIPAAMPTRLQELAVCFRPRMSPDVQNKIFAKL